MTSLEAAIVSAYTGFLCGKLEPYYKYVKKIMGRPIFIHEMADKNIMNEISERAKPDFVRLEITK